MGKKRVGLVGWRGMVGSVLIERMREENDFALFEPVYFSTSQVGTVAPDGSTVLDAKDIRALKTCDIVLSCQGGDYTSEVYAELRSAGFRGPFIDAASTLRMKDHAVIVLDPVNRHLIDAARKRGIVDFVGGNCTVSLMLMVMAGLLREGLVEWISTMTYQAASGAGARHMIELVRQMRRVGALVPDDDSVDALTVDERVIQALRSPDLPAEHFGVPLACNLIPWIDKAVEGGSTREEWKGHVEANKMLALYPEVPIDGICVRVGAMRCHSQALTIKLKKSMSTEAFEDFVRSSNPWVKVVPNTPEDTKRELTPLRAQRTLDVMVGRVKKLKMGDAFIGCFTVGDQLLWGAAEPLRRVLRMLLES